MAEDAALVDEADEAADDTDADADEADDALLPEALPELADVPDEHPMASTSAHAQAEAITADLNNVRFFTIGPFPLSLFRPSRIVAYA